MKIGILTFHAARNYGAVLQCRCLYEVLRSMGHEVSVIDYRPDYLTEPYKLWKNKFLRHPMTMLKVSSRIAGAARREAGFSSFDKEITLTPFGEGGFDAIFYGSDQIWNRNICNGIDPVFYAAEPFAASAVNIAYAASDGDVIPTDEEKVAIRRYLHNFQYIGVRESGMVERMDSEGIPADLNLDPVLLAGRPVVDNLCSAPVISEPYVLTYEAIDNTAVADKARRIAAERGLKVVQVARAPYSEGINKFSPREFVALFRDADYIVTTSFHGTALAILYDKEYEFVHTGTHADGRIDSLLDSLGDRPEENLERLRKQSLHYIENALASVK
jgi:hypothetical protein